MKKTFLIVAALVSLTAFAFAGEVLKIMIDVAPNVLNLQRTDDKCVTVHTDISYSEVDCTSVTLEAGDTKIGAASCKSDDRGNFVAKFSMEDVNNFLPLIEDEYNILTLAGKTNATDSVDFEGEQDILVINNPKDR